VDAVDGWGPYDGTGSQLTAGLEDLLAKPDGIEVVMDGTIESRGEDHAWTRDELRTLADQHFDMDVPEGTIKMHVLFVDGHDAQDDEDGKTLGLAWGHTHMALFKRSIEQSCSSGPFGGIARQRLCRKAEQSIWTHEVGHTIGLVDNGLPMVMDHRDPDHGRHDRNDECVMYWAYEREGVFQTLRNRFMNNNESALGFDEACRQDIAALRDG
jgi:hypothetical protein